MTLTPGTSLNGYVIYKNQQDNPGKFVVRVRRNVGADSIVDPVPLAVVDSLDSARHAIRDTDCLLCLPRGPQDDPNVVETWV
ncbi:MAG: hypothetical protein A3G34_02090 [Candidatus Lindowbacteria bacterium RIFCSPLOWO2_12_FULL_62_27]|nr:MAG: hypothetical protein A3G34_02090 [Candidatus Lindowbacteria bacterium RIFCSPLOWO2_12_FULL_62_27]OGH61241.1 MAG: hypothetical protein A3I06_15700 [Candidatus Lindowbacteria bacterium RIFCSPLOWO2_02_FULL_62_12]